MIHLVLHLVEEVKLGGPVQYRWMYPIERFLGKLKSFVGNKAHPEGSIVEGWISEEMLSFCSLYLEDNIKSKFNPQKRFTDRTDNNVEDTSVFKSIGKHIGGVADFELTQTEMLQAHRHVLVNCAEVEPFLQECKDETRRRL